MSAHFQSSPPWLVESLLPHLQHRAFVVNLMPNSPTSGLFVIVKPDSASEKINLAGFGRDRFGLHAMQARDKLRLR